MPSARSSGSSAPRSEFVAPRPSIRHALGARARGRRLVVRYLSTHAALSAQIESGGQSSGSSYGATSSSTIRDRDYAIRSTRCRLKRRSRCHPTFPVRSFFILKFCFASSFRRLALAAYPRVPFLHVRGHQPRPCVGYAHVHAVDQRRPGARDAAASTPSKVAAIPSFSRAAGASSRLSGPTPDRHDDQRGDDDGSRPESG